MESLEEIKPSKDTVMTTELIRIFAAAGCAPTLCHACGTVIPVGAIFKLVPHRKPSLGLAPGEYNDEMCCGLCSSNELKDRDKREAAFKKKNSRGGYSRASKHDDIDFYEFENEITQALIGK